MREHTEIDRHTHWMDIKKKLDQDFRYKAISESILREDYFYAYIKILKEERKKKKAKKSDKKEKKKKEKSKDKDRTSKDKNESVKSEGNGEAKEGSESTEKQPDDREKPIPVENDNKSDDASEKSDSDKDEEGEHSGTDPDSETERVRKDKDRQARAEASIKARAEEVHKTLAENFRERDKERQHHKRDEAVRHFTALLADLVRNSDLGWKEVKKQLKKDLRWELVENLDREEKERLFNDHISSLAKKKRDKFREMLDEANLELTAVWKNVKRQVKDDPRFLKFGHSEKVSLNSAVINSWFQFSISTV